MATLSRRRRWRTTSSENAADAHAQSLSGRPDSDPARRSGKSNPTSKLARPAWLRLAAARRIRPPSWAQSKRQPWSNAGPTVLLLIGKDGAARSRPYRRGVGRDRRTDRASPRRLAWDLASFRHAWVDVLHLARLRKAQVRPSSPKCAPRSETQVADLL
jgi:hypothetical protein